MSRYVFEVTRTVKLTKMVGVEAKSAQEAASQLDQMKEDGVFDDALKDDNWTVGHVKTSYKQR